MLLKRVSMCGFKSFCDKVDFDFGAGVTCIVGPNGCGKSNVVDAIKWVLGEQSARSLRGRQMQDMIFGGSSARKSSSVAQVDLVFDNADRRLPIDLEEVTVTRKLYRSGESEYLLNGGGSRLKDVRELIMDTGVGVDAYCVIEQGRVDRLLQSSPQDRRIIFEEAAGISKYKARKREAERKLERTQQNLLRVADILEELEKRLRSVKLQAGKARSYQEYQARLSELRSTFALAEYHRFTEQIEIETRQVESFSDQVTALRTQIDRDEAEESRGAIELDRLGQEVSAVESRLIQARSEVTAQSERIEASRQRITEQQTVRTRAAERKDADSSRLESARVELSTTEKAAEELQQQSALLRARTDELNEQDRQLARELAAAQAILEEEKVAIIELLRRGSQLNNDIIRLNTHRESLVGQKGRLAARDAQIAAELGSATRQRDEYAAKLREIEARIAEHTADLEAKRSDAQRVNQIRQKLVEELAAAKEQRSALLSRQEVLNDLQRKMDGVGAGVRKLLDEKRSGRESRLHAAIVGMVADIFETDVAHALIVEAAIGRHEQDLLVATCGDFVESPEEFAALPGRLTAICEDRIPPLVNPRDFSGQEGYVCRAIDLVRYTEPYDGLARYLFGKTIVVETLADAVNMARADVEGHRFVTRRGEVVDSGGRISVGPLDSASGLISRKSELREISSQLEEVDFTIGSLSEELNRTQAEGGYLETAQQELRAALYEGNAARVEANSAVNNLSESIERLRQEQPLIAQEVALLDQQMTEIQAKASGLGAALAEVESESKRREGLTVERQQAIDEIASRRGDLQEQVTQAKVAFGQLTEKRSAAVENVNALRRKIHDLEFSVNQAEHDIAQCAARIQEAEGVIAAGSEQLAKLASQIEKLEDEAAGLRRTRDELRITLDGLSHTVKAARGQLAEVESRLHEHQMALGQAGVRRDDLVARVVDELGVNLSERYLEYQHQDQDWAAVESEIAELRGKIDRLGNVNLDAINELAEIEQRHEFLSSQQHDLNQSIGQLNELIELLNRESQERFKTAFEEIRENFRTLFRKLFGGGKADIIMEDAENMLDSGIEIVAQPPGKELRAISLMSGGEKSMTAIALLMSIFKTKPAPFAILDEVDAALDEANNERFNRIVREFVSDSQFIVITHSKRTMSIGDRLYGVTMQEPGVSTRVSVRLDQAEVA